MRLILPLCLLVACAPTLTRTVEGLVMSGDMENALNVTLAAAKSGNPKAVELLPGVAEDRYDGLLDQATEAEAEDQLLNSLEHYDALIALEAEVVAAGGPRVKAVDLPADRKRVARSAAFKRFSQGEVAFAEGRFESALAAFRDAERLAGDDTQAARLIPHTLTELGHAARDRQRYREAITYYDEAVSLGAGESPRIWAAAIHAALGRAALEDRACRKAVFELTKATALPFDVDLGGDLERARECAMRELVVHPLEDLVDGGVDENLGVLLMDQLNHHLRAHGSRYLKLLAADSKAAKKLPEDAGLRFEVRGHLTRIEVDKAEAKTEPATATGVLKVPCSPGEAPTCTEQVNVAYQLTTERLQVDIAGAIEVVDMVSGEQLMTRPLDVRLSRTRFSAADAKATDVRGFGVQAPVGVRATDRTIGVTGEAAAHFRKSEPLPDADKVIDEAFVRLAGDAADAVLASVDMDQPHADPETLRLVTPVARAEDLVFGEAVIEQEAPPAPEAPEGEDDEPRDGPDTEQ